MELPISPLVGEMSGRTEGARRNAIVSEIRLLLELIERSFYSYTSQRGFHGAHDRFRRRKDRSSGPRGGGQPDRASRL
ncbi:hypothetical protein BQ8794_60155 [Mesorhizobium prunaredense]|uniref:Uncharacterized protein n=1 Tax=Mesorhizobium prunaredense TaxID=1631249 RepID=A0A1R3VG58_9HYPH|nr:hypothetical protein BQ8794_60155 [Mesorhizobium prunaredense]